MISTIDELYNKLLDEGFVRFNFVDFCVGIFTYSNEKYKLSFTAEGWNVLQPEEDLEYLVETSVLMVYDKDLKEFIYDNT